MQCWQISFGMEEQRRKRFKILFFLMKPESDERKNSYFQRRKKGLSCLVIIVALTVITRGLGNEGPLYTLNSQALHIKGTESLWDNSRSSQEVRHNAFLKVHKTGSSTLQNIFLRFGYKRNLTIVLPTKGNKLTPNIPLLDPLKDKRYDILAIHSRFNHSVFTSLLPNDSVYIGTVRDPLEVMISSAYYHRNMWHVPYLQKVPDENFIQNLIRFPEKYDQQEYSLTKNSMADVFGFPKGLHLSDKSKIQKYLEYLGTIFRLVLITEHFNESLVLLKRYLHWKLTDILFIPLNEYKHYSVKELNITELEKSKFKERNYIDYALYNFFYERFVKQISLEKDIIDEVAHFASVQRRVQLYCLLSDTQGLRISGSRWNESFLVTKSDCDLMKMPELDFIEKLRQEHIQALLNEIS